ncbi:hypothetical protein L484_008270 [Morus notabilis]|uniref:Uncharacterized protein n=1 Tax=Morus notabilis TaxID=981085 RepID=W9R6N3_9ROSA|nr:hypothetical protein L484_008270 [Morus notabilis]
MVCHEVINVEGRHLKSTRFRRCSKSGDQQHSTYAYSRPEVQTSKAEHVDDFRPTAPGHSPGVGHSINN